MEESIFDLSEKLTVTESGNKGGILNREHVAIRMAWFAPAAHNLSLPTPDNQKASVFDRDRDSLHVQMRFPKVFVTLG
jgi:hypothetical protein